MSGYALVLNSPSLDAYSCIDSFKLILIFFQTCSNCFYWGSIGNLFLSDMENIIRSSLMSCPNVPANFKASSSRQNNNCSLHFSSDQLYLLAMSWNLSQKASHSSCLPENVEKYGQGSLNKKSGIQSYLCAISS